LASLAWDPSAEARAPKIALSVLLALFACGVLAYRREALELTGPLSWTAAWVLWCALSLTWGSLEGAEQVASLAAALCLGLSARTVFFRDELRRQLRLVGLVVGVAASLLATREWLLGARGSAVHGGMGNPNWLGLVLGPCVMLSASGWARLPRRGRALVGIAIAVELGGLALAQSRTVWIACASAVVVTLVWRRLPTRRHYALVALAFCVPLLGAVGADAPAAGGDWLSAVAGRRWIWRVSLDAAWSALPFGAGTGEFAGAFLRSQGALLATLDPGAAARTFQNASTAHSDWLETLLEHGLVGSVLLAGWLAKSLSSTWTSGRAALITLVVTAIADSPLHQPAVVVLALLVAAASDEPPTARTTGFPRLPAWSWLLLVAGLGLAARISVGTWLGARSTTAAQDNPERRLEHLARARALDPYSAQVALEYGSALLDAGEPARSLEQTDASLRLSTSVAAYLLRAKALSVLGRKPEAVRDLTEALGLNPASFRVNLGLAALELEAGRLDSAERALGRARRVLPGDPRLEPLEEQIKSAVRARELQ
jgi:tetratricopeptide (TPR) repeat protein